jgi:hypothetical protein
MDGSGLSRMREGFCVRQDEETDPYSVSKIVVKTGNDESTLIIAWELWSIAPARGFCIRQNSEDRSMPSHPYIEEERARKRRDHGWPAGWGFGLLRTREGFCVRQDEET